MVRLLDLPHHRARAAVDSGAPVYLPVNPVEFHGPHLSLHNDHLLSMGMIRDLHAALSEGRDWPLILSDSIELGFEPVPGPGSRPTPFPVLLKAVLQACDALADLGAKRVVLVTFHGAPLHNLAIQRGVERLARRGVPAFAPMHLVLEAALGLDPAQYTGAVAHISDDEERAAALAELPGDFHAGFFETSLALHWAPETVSPIVERLPPCAPVTPDRGVGALARAARRLGSGRLADELDFAARGLGWYSLRPFPGYTGRPHLASAEAGARFVEAIFERTVAAAEAVGGGGGGGPGRGRRGGGRRPWGGGGGGIHVPPGEIVTAPPG